VGDISAFLRAEIGSRQNHHRDGDIAEDGKQWRPQEEVKERRIPQMDKDIISVQNKLKGYFISKGFKEVQNSYFWGAEHPVLGRIAYHNDGKTFGFSFLSDEVRNSCGYTRAERQKMSKIEKEDVYRSYLEKKPYYKDIKYGWKLFPRKSATDYVGLYFTIGFERIVKVMENVWAGRSLSF